MKKNIIAVVAIFAAFIGSVHADYITVLAGSGSPVAISAAVGVIYSDQSSGQIWAKNSTGTNGWFIAAPAITGTLVITNGSATVTNSLINSNSYVNFSLAQTNGATNSYAASAGTGTITFTGAAASTNTIRYFIYTP